MNSINFKGLFLLFLLSCLSSDLNMTDWAKIEARSYTVVYGSEGPVLYETGESR